MKSSTEFLYSDQSNFRNLADLAFFSEPNSLKYFTVLLGINPESFCSFGDGSPFRINTPFNPPDTASSINCLSVVRFLSLTRKLTVLLYLIIVEYLPVINWSFV